MNPYMANMAIFPRPASPRSTADDLWNYLTASRAHKWPLLGLSVALTWLIIWAFIVDSSAKTVPRQDSIIYIENWKTNRSDAAIIRQQKRDLAEYEVRLLTKQREVQKVADMFGIEWRKEAARNDARRLEALKYINAQLDKRLIAAEAHDKASHSGALTRTPVKAK